MSSFFTIAAQCNFTLLIVFILIMIVCWVLTWNVDKELSEMREPLDESQFEIKGDIMNKSITNTAKDFATREQTVINNFCDYVTKNTNCSKNEAIKVFNYYKKHKLMKIDLVTGDYRVKHGMLLDVSTIKECLKLIKELS